MKQKPQVVWQTDRQVGIAENYPSWKCGEVRVEREVREGGHGREGGLIMSYYIKVAYRH